MTDTMRHVTLATGDDRESPRSEVGEEVLRRLRPALLAAVQAPGRPRPRVPLPGPTGYELSATADGGAAAVTIWHAPDPVLAPTQPIPIVTLGIASEAATDEQAAELWTGLRGPSDLAPAAPPPAPWCAAPRPSGTASAASLWPVDADRRSRTGDP